MTHTTVHLIDHVEDGEKLGLMTGAVLRRSIPLSLRSYDRYLSINSPTFVLGDNIFDVTKGKSKDYYNLLITEKA